MVISVDGVDMFLTAIVQALAMEAQILMKQIISTHNIL